MSWQATKHGVQGIIRSLRKSLYQQDKIRINVVCPGLTESNMTDGIFSAFAQRGLATNSPDEVALSIAGLLTEKDMYGKGIYVEGGKCWELEDGIVKTMPQWLGEGPTKRLWEGLDFVATVSFGSDVLFN
jgi:NAD(P)-dependent dehydrogenase (short-subunit alcohol dehydrogenase family)